jgi:hypothetical protein
MRSLAVALARSRAQGLPGQSPCGLLATGIGESLADDLSTTAGMAPIPPDKTGVASGVLNTLRLIDLAVGAALTEFWCARSNTTG